MAKTFSLLFIVLLILIFVLPARAQQSELENFSEALIKADNETARQQLLTEKPALISSELVKVLLTQSRAYIAKNQYQQAESILLLARDIAKRIDDQAALANIARGIGLLHYNQDDLTNALSYFQESLKYARAINNPVAIVKALNNSGAVYDSQGNPEAALACYQQSLKLIENSQDHATRYATFTNISLNFVSQNRYDEALVYCEKALQIAEAANQSGDIAISLLNLGVIQERLGNEKSALDYYRRSGELFEKLGEQSYLSQALNNIGSMQLLGGDYQQARANFEKCYQLAVSTGNRYAQGESLSNFGYLYYLQGDYQRALDYYQQALKPLTESGLRPVVTDVYNNISEVLYHTGDYQCALELATVCAQELKALGNSRAFARAMINAGKAYVKLRQPAKARDSFQQSITAIESVREQVIGEQDRERFFESAVTPYYQIVSLLVDQEQYFAALSYAEQAKARVLLDLLRNGKVDITQSMTAEEIAREQALTEQLNQLNRKIIAQQQNSANNRAQLPELLAQQQQARFAYDAFTTSLYGHHPELKLSRGQTQLLTSDQIGELIKDHTALIEYVIGDERSFLFVISRASQSDGKFSPAIKVYPLAISKADLTKQVEQFKRKLAQGALDFSDQAQSLYNILLKPAQNQLAGINTLAIVPDDSLWELPFQALQPTAPRFLIEDFAIFYTSSLSVLYQTTKQHPPTAEQTLLAFGNPFINKVGNLPENRLISLPPLPAAEQQVLALQDIIGAAESRIFTGKAAREEVVKTLAGKYRILHFATHGILDNSNPMYSYLVLAQNDQQPGEDGLLTAHEIIKLKIVADMVVLSACQTAQGRYGPGEGIIGMNWAWFVAGSRATVVSQWQIDSASTTKLIIKFYQNLFQPPDKNITKAMAMRNAALTLIEDQRYHHPFYWAGLIIIGNGL